MDATQVPSFAGPTGGPSPDGVSESPTDEGSTSPTAVSSNVPSVAEPTPPTSAPSSSIVYCEEDIVQVTSTVSMQISGDLTSIDPTTLASIFAESYNSFRSGVCDNHAASVLVLGTPRSRNSRRLVNATDFNSTIGQGTSDTVVETVTFLVTVDCSPSISTCTPEYVFDNEVVSEVALTEKVTETAKQQTGALTGAASTITVSTGAPSLGPSLFSSVVPSNEPSSVPYMNHQSFLPTNHPSSLPSSLPSEAPSSIPTLEVTTIGPSQQPSFAPSSSPSSQPSSNPSRNPSFSPSIHPSSVPSITPSSHQPSSAPSERAVCIESEQDKVLVFQDFEDGRYVGWNREARVDQTGSPFSSFLGRFYQGDVFPYRIVSGIDPLGINRIFVSFNFFEIDGELLYSFTFFGLFAVSLNIIISWVAGWDGNGKGGPDTFGVKVEGDLLDEIDFGHFHYNYNEPDASGSSVNGFIQWIRKSDLIAHSPQGFLDLSDQRHFILFEVPRSFIFVGHQLKITITWNLVGERDESVG
jgi:hypothetical protein